MFLKVIIIRRALPNDDARKVLSLCVFDDLLDFEPLVNPNSLLLQPLENLIFYAVVVPRVEWVGVVYALVFVEQALFVI